ncbi:hypothetical protein ACH4TQ_30760 [Streptomyces sp. NPDC021218]|uniref:hypothetical protein n=1 Tax=Streptomyces sp. NPDC021218 TaxID=3365119 RepID=UPI00379AC647
MTEQDASQSVTVGTVRSRTEKEAEVVRWLLTAAADKRQALEEWRQSGVALLECGDVFEAVRIPAHFVQAAAASYEPDRVDKYLAHAVFGGPVIIDPHSRWYYALVPPGTAERWRHRRVLETDCLRTGSVLGVPHPTVFARGAQVAHSYWVVPMNAPEALCLPRAVFELAAYGRFVHEAITAEKEKGA